MATLNNSQNQNTIKLRSQHVFGRHPATAHTLLNHQAASRIHATIYWNGNRWLIKDSSTNGTFINGKKLVTGRAQRLSINDLIQFGSEHGFSWRIEDLAPPSSMLVCVGQHHRSIELQELTVLPDNQAPEISIYRNALSQWIIETEHEQKNLTTGQQLSIAGERWIFICPDDIDETKPTVIPNEQSTLLSFEVSSDEEHINLTIDLNKERISLGERVHHYLLLCLARKRLSDKTKGIKTTEQGWLEKELLINMTGMEEKHINIQIYRFRKQLLENQSSLGRALLPIIQRRRGQLRLDCDDIVIQGGHQI